MNLWAKSLRQLSFVAAVALFFFSCEDENAILGFKNPVPKFNVSYVEIPLTSNAQLIDSIITDNKAAVTGTTMVGRYQDNVFGTMQAESYLQIIPAQAVSVIPENAIFDSVTVQVRYNFYGYGFQGESTEAFAIHELVGPLDRAASTRYRFNSSVPFNSTPMAHAKVKVLSDSLSKQYSTPSAQQDTLIARARLSDAFGIKIFNYAKTYTFTDPAQSSGGSSRDAQVNDFLTGVQGLAFIPTDSKGILGLNISSGLSTVTVHYRTVENGAVKDTTSRTYPFSGPSFTKISADRAGSPLAGAQPYQSASEASTTGLRYIQSGNPVVTKLDFSNFYAFADTVGNVLIDDAQLVIDGIESPVATPAIRALGLKVMNANNQFTNSSLATTDRVAMTPYGQNGVLLNDGKHYIVRVDPQQNSNLEMASLDYSNGKYSGIITLFLQQLVKHRANADRLTYLGLYSLIPSVSTSVSRTIFDAKNVKLRIYYTKPTLSTLPN